MTKVMTQTQMPHGFRRAIPALFLGGCALGLFAAGAPNEWLDNERKFKSDDPAYNYRRSEHFRILWGQGNARRKEENADFSRVTEQLAQGNLQMLERVWQAYHAPPPLGLGFNPTGESASSDKRDGKRYRANLMMNNTGIWAGGAWGSVDDWGYPMFALPPSYLAYDPPSGATPHEYGHTVLISAGGFNDTPYDGMWHEATANWLQLQFLNSYPGPGGVGMQPFLSVPHGRNYYDSWQIWEYFREDPHYGTAFVNKLWTQANGSRKKGAEYMFDAMVRLHPAGAADPYNAIKDAVGRMAARNVMWDYQRKAFFQKHTPRTMDPFTEVYRRAYTELVRRPGDSSWFRVPFAHAPMQCGYNVVPIALNGKVGGNYPVSVDFRPLWDATRRSDWRATLVAVNDNGESRYSAMWNSGINSITLSADENQLFLCVATTPDFMAFEGFQRPLISDLPLQPQAYEISFINTRATAYETKPVRPAGVAGKPHPNGGGFVADTAKVEPSAHVGPNAMVLGKAQVLGLARIEDFGVVMGNAIVKDSARVSGHALVRDNAEISGNGKVRDWATVQGRWKVYENGRALERAYLLDRGELSGNATIKGNAPDFGNAKVGGHAIKDGDCANGANVDRQTLMCWVWGTDQKYADSRPDNEELYCHFSFKRSSPIFALDNYGVTHGYLMGAPKTVTLTDTNLPGALALNGKDQYVELRRDVADFADATLALWVNWAGGAADQRIFHFGDGTSRYAYLTPKDAATGKVKFAIRAGQSAEQALIGPAPLPSGIWTHVALTLKGDTGVLFIDGKPVATSAKMTLNPDQVLGPNTSKANDAVFLGRGDQGNFFGGLIADFRVYVQPQEIPLLTKLAGQLTNRKTVVAAAQGDNRPPALAASGFLQPPAAINETAVVMSAPKGTDDSNWVEYWFTRTSGGRAESGWISANRWTDCAVETGKTYAYAFKLRDRHGNETPLSVPARVTVPETRAAPTASEFSDPPRGLSAAAIRMTAKKARSAAGLTEYKFTRSDGKTSGWQSSAVWTDTGLAPGSKHAYTVEVRDAWGRAGKPSAPAAAIVRDDTPPARYPIGEWQTMPFSTVSNTIVMKATSVTGEHGCPKIETNAVEYFFHCVSGGGPDSGWIEKANWQTPPLPDGTYLYAFKMRDTSPQRNETSYSSAEKAEISPQTGYHRHPLSRLPSLVAGTLVSFQGKVTGVETNAYIISSSGASITVVPRTAAGATEETLKNRDVVVQGCLWKSGPDLRVVWAEVQ